MRRSRAWSKKGTEAVIPTASTRAVSHTVIGAISAISVINITMRVPLSPKKIKIQGGKKRKAAPPKVPEAKGTTTGHYLNFIRETLDIMDRYPEMKGFYLIMDNAPTHSSNKVNQMVESLYSPELNPIEQFWAIVKHKLKRNQPMESETLAQRITEACNLVPLSHLVNITQHSKNPFENCLNIIPI